MEGSVSGTRAAALAKEREVQAAAFEAARNDLQSSSRILPKNINDKFSHSRHDGKKDKVETEQYGLATLDQYRRAKAGEINDAKQTDAVDDTAIAQAEARAEASRARAAKNVKRALPFFLLVVTMTVAQKMTTMVMGLFLPFPPCPRPPLRLRRPHLLPPL